MRVNGVKKGIRSIVDRSIAYSSQFGYLSQDYLRGRHKFDETVTLAMCKTRTVF
jgi:hypothetical protein